jgi:hypothetical protein
MWLVAPPGIRRLFTILRRFAMRVFMTACIVALFVFMVSCSGPVNGLGDVSRNTSETAFGTAWNAHCASCNFVPKGCVAGSLTNYAVGSLGAMYYGTDFARDIAKLAYMIMVDTGVPNKLANAGPEVLYIWYDEDGLYPDEKE